MKQRSLDARRKERLWLVSVESEWEGHAATPILPFQTTEAIVGVVDGGERLQCFRLSEKSH